MLVLARQKDQSIIIGDNVLVKVVDVRGDKVRLGISAPLDVSVHRKEVYDEIQEENRAASKAPFSHLPQAIAPQKSTDPFLLAALQEARESLAEGGLPMGAVLVRHDQIISRGRNRRIQDNNPLSQAEIECLSHAGRQPTFRDTLLYCTLLPSPIGIAALRQLGIPRVIVGDASIPEATKLMRSHRVELLDLHDQSCIEMNARYFQEHPDLWKENAGV